ncbi:MAG TPA: mechanosensitive ion channel family protein [Polyangiaceae bacterium]|nr:mechanosensitive ion channel family protein [Polyangiaceae bacterium]
MAVSTLLIVTRGLVMKRARAWSERSPSRIDDFFVSLLASVRSLFFVAIGLWVAAEYVHISANVQRSVRTILTLLALVQVGLSLQAAVRALSRDWAGSTDAGETKMAASASAFLASLAIWAVLIVSGLSVLGFEISALLAGLGVGGVAAALAVQNILGDVFASLSIYFDRPFQIGDFIITGDEMGTVERIGLRTTRVRSLGGEEIVFANGDLTKSRIRNYKRMAERRVVFGFGVEYGTSLENLKTIPGLVRAIVGACPNLRHDRAHFKEYGDFALNFEVVYYVLSPDYNTYMDHQQAINLALFREFGERGIDFAFPTQKVLLSHQALVPTPTGTVRADHG